MRNAGLVHLQAMASGLSDVIDVEIQVTVDGDAHYFDGIHVDGMTCAEICRQVLRVRELPELAIIEALPAVNDAAAIHYRKALDAGTSPGDVIDGVPETLIQLREAGAVMGLLTGGTRGVVDAKLDACGLDEFFAFGGYGDRWFERHELFYDALRDAQQHVGWSGTASQVIYVGDTIRDIEAARRVGAQVIAVATGAFSSQQLEQADADFTVASLPDARRDLLTLLTNTASG